MRIHDGRTEKQLSVHILLNNYEAEEGEGKREEGGREGDDRDRDHTERDELIEIHRDDRDD